MFALILTFATLPDGHRHERAGEVVHVGRNDEAAAGHLAANQLGRERFALRHDAHRVGDDAVARVSASACCSWCS